MRVAGAERNGDDDEEVMVDLRRVEGLGKRGAGRCLIEDEKGDLRLRREAAIAMVLDS